jgi:hypothetical protein
MKEFLTAALAMLAAVLAQAQDAAAPPRQTSHAEKAAAPGAVPKNLAGWPQATQELAARLTAKYGPPQESTSRELIWYGNRPWKRTVLHKEGVRHNFPRPHQDILEQTVNYRVPSDKVSELVAYNGSLVVDRTRGELTAHCDSEEANTLTLNLADDIVKGERSTDQALAYHAQVIRGMEIGEPESYPEKLRFTVAKSNAQTADPAEEAELLSHLEH